MAANNLRNTIHGLDFLSSEELIQVVKYIVDNQIGMNDRVKLESYLLDEINNTDPDPEETDAVKGKKNHIAKVLGWRDYKHMESNRDEISKSTWRAFHWIMTFPS